MVHGCFCSELTASASDPTPLGCDDIIDKAICQAKNKLRTALIEWAVSDILPIYATRY